MCVAVGCGSWFLLCILGTSFLAGLYTTKKADPAEQLRSAVRLQNIQQVFFFIKDLLVLFLLHHSLFLIQSFSFFLVAIPTVHKSKCSSDAPPLNTSYWSALWGLFGFFFSASLLASGEESFVKWLRQIYFSKRWNVASREDDGDSQKPVLGYQIIHKDFCILPVWSKIQTVF